MRLPIHTRSLILDAELSDGHMRFRIDGNYDAQDLERMIPAMLEEIVRNGLERALIDIRAMTGELPDLDRYTLGESFVKHWGIRRRAAVLVDTSKQRINKLFETVAVNRAGQVRVGDRAEELLAWLMAD
jgi:hypothetical protein